MPASMLPIRAAGTIERGDCDSVAGACCGGDGSRGLLTAEAVRHSPRSDRTTAGNGLHAPHSPACAHRTLEVDADVAEVAGVPRRSDERPALDDQSATHTRGHHHAHHVIAALPCPTPVLTDRNAHRVSCEMHLVAGHESFEMTHDREPTPRRDVHRAHRASAEIDRPSRGHAHAGACREIDVVEHRADRGGDGCPHFVGAAAGGDDLRPVVNASVGSHRRGSDLRATDVDHDGEGLVRHVGTVASADGSPVLPIEMPSRNVCDCRV